MSGKRGKEVEVSDAIDFCWGEKKRRVGSTNKDAQFYNSFRFDGVNYSLYDCVYFIRNGVEEPYVGKLVKIWEDEKKGKNNVKVLWFFRPSEISNFLQGVDVLKNELFLATGVGDGLCNINTLEAIAGKCNVVCISKDNRNRQPSGKELEMADFVFYRTFDVEHRTVSDKLDDKIATVDVKLLLNKEDLAKLASVNVAVDTAETPTSAEGTLMALPKCRSSEKLGTTVSNSTASVVGGKKKAISCNDAQDLDGDVNCGSGLGSLGKKGDVAKRDTCMVPSASTRRLGSGQETTLNSADPKRTKLKKIGEGAVTATAANNGKSEPVNNVKKRVADAGNLKPDDGLSKKRNLDASARDKVGTNGTGTQKSVNVSAASNKVSEPTGCAAETNDGGKLTRDPGCSIDTPLNMRKNIGATPLTDVKTSDRSNKASGKLSEDSRSLASKATQHPRGVSESKDRGQLRRKPDGTSEEVSKKRKSNSSIEKPNAKLSKVSNNDKKIQASNQVKEVAQRLHDTSKWFSAKPWEDRMKDASDEETLVYLQNLDPTYTSSEVENIIYRGFQERCSVQIVQRTPISSPYSGEALVIFNTKAMAHKVVNKLEEDCLMLPNGRPLVGTIMSFPENQPSPYFGHLVLKKSKQHMQKSERDVESTSHSAQPNTIEYEMALAWRRRQQLSVLEWKLLDQKQADDIKKLKVDKKGEDLKSK